MGDDARTAPPAPGEAGPDGPTEEPSVGEATREVGLGRTRSATAGGVAGAAVGGVVGGPPGMVVGAVTGVARGLLLQGAAEKVDEMAEAKGREIADTLLGPPDEEKDAGRSGDASSADPDAA
jgi:hypothetical protein